MDALTSLEYALPEILWALAGIPVAVSLLVLRERQRRSVANRFVSENLRGVSNSARVVRPVLLAVAIAAGLIAVAQPRAGYTLVPVAESDANLVIAMDISQSMAAEDVGTSRLSAAKALTRRLVETFDGKVALVVFEARAETVAPLTSDGSAVVSLLDSIGTGESGEAGSDLGEAIRVSLKTTEVAASQPTQIVLISDGEHKGEDFEDWIRVARERGVVISTITVGLAAGATVPKHGGGLLLDESGKVVTSRAHPEIMQRIASGAGGTAFVNPFYGSVLASIEQEIAGRLHGSTKARETKIPNERYQWPLAVAIFAFLASSFLNRGAE